MIGRRQFAATLVSTSSAGLGGCAWLQRPTPVAMDYLFDDRACAGTQAPVLLVLLPGVHMAPVELVAQGFVAALRQRGLAVDVALPDAHIGYAQDGSIGRHLHDDVIAPLRARGYRRVWLAGISLGGFVALGYAQQHPGSIEGLVALAPYLGRQLFLQAVVQAGGPRAWAAMQRGNADDPAIEAAVERAVWQWLADPPVGAPRLWLGYGRDDRFAEAHRMLAGLLPPERVAVVPGDHDWPPWRALWAQWLDRAAASGLLPTGCKR